MNVRAILLNNPDLAPILAGAAHIDVKTVTGTVTMREFVAAMLAYQPRWVLALYAVRGVFVRVLGMRQNGLPRASRVRPDDLPMQSGERAGIFTVRTAADERYWVAGVADSHLDAVLGVVREPLHDNLSRFHVLTVVHYNNWAGPVYFTVIRPFHHLVVGRMAAAGVRTTHVTFPAPPAL